MGLFFCYVMLPRPPAKYLNYFEAKVPLYADIAFLTFVIWNL